MNSMKEILRINWESCEISNDFYSTGTSTTDTFLYDALKFLRGTQL